MQEFGIADAPPKQAQQLAVPNSIETGTDVALYRPPVTAPMCQARRQIGDGIFGTPVRPKAIRMTAEVRLIDWFQDHPEPFLDDSVPKSGNA
jgi:hypothetical protein